MREEELRSSRLKLSFGLRRIRRNKSRTKERVCKTITGVRRSKGIPVCSDFP